MKFQSIQKECRFTSEEDGFSFCVNLSYDGEFGWWEASSSFVARAAQHELQALDQLKGALEKALALLNEQIDLENP